MNKTFHFLIVSTFFLAPAFGAIPKKDRALHKELRLPAKVRVQRFKRKGKSGYKRLRKAAFDYQLPLKLRWNALASMAILGKKESLPDLKKAVASSEWFMRDAALKAMTYIAPKHAKRWARKLISDRSLIVRTTAVDSLRKLRDRSSVKLLWKKLYSKQNFRNSQSLWVRRHIVETLAEMEKRGAEAKFIRVLRDKDESLYKPAIRALERLTKKRLGKKDEPIKFKRVYWRKWWASKKRS